MGNFDMRGLFYLLVGIGFVIGVSVGIVGHLAYQKFHIRIEVSP